MNEMKKYKQHQLIERFANDKRMRAYVIAEIKERKAITLKMDENIN